MKQEIKRQTALKAELETINERISEMQKKHKVLADEYKNQQDLFLSNASSFEKLADSESALQTASNALRLLEGKQTQLQNAISEADAADQRAEQLQLAMQAGNATVEAHDGYNTARTQLAEAISKFINKMHDFSLQYRTNQSEFHRLFDSISGDRHADIFALGFTEPSLKIANGQVIQQPEIEFEKQIAELELMISHQRNGVKSSAATATSDTANRFK